ncbi:MAG: acyltransferase [Pirellulales bacterium]
MRVQRLTSVDALRGLASLAVLVYHVYGDGFSKPGPDHPLLQCIAVPASVGYVGVNLFLVLSGFCIHMGVARQDALSGFNFVAFWKRRFFRLYPPYLAAMVLSVLIGIIGTISVSGGLHFSWPPSPYSNTNALVGDFWAHVFMLHILFPATIFGVFNPPLWSLALEEQLYAMYSIYLWLLARITSLRLTFIALVVSFVWRGITLVYLDNNSFPWLMQAPSRWFEWCLGALAAEFYCERVRLPKWCLRLWLCPVLLVGACCLQNLPPLGITGADPLYGVGFFILLNYYCQREKLGELSRGLLTRLLAFVGTWSYSLYLIHAPTIRLFRAVFHVLRLDSQPELCSLILLVVSLLAGGALYWCVERHFLKKPAAKPEAGRR